MATKHTDMETKPPMGHLGAVEMRRRLDSAMRAASDMASILSGDECAKLSRDTRLWIVEHLLVADMVRAHLDVKAMEIQVPALIPDSQLVAAALTSLGERVTAIEETLRPTQVFRNDGHGALATALNGANK